MIIFDSINKFRLLTILLLILSISCSRELPSYEDLNKPDKEQEQEQDKEQETDKEEEKPVTPAGTFHIDEALVLEFKSAPSLGTTGTIQICKEDGTEVDIIKIEDVVSAKEKMTDASLYNTAMNALGPESLKRWRIVHYNPISIDGNKAIIRPHSGKLAYSTAYQVIVSADAFIADGFSGIKAGEWKFTTKAEPASKEEVTVARSGDADFRTIQAAIDWAYVCGKDKPMTINIKNGVYEEPLFARTNNKITFKGESREGTVLNWSNSEEFSNGVGGSTGVKPSAGKAIGKSGGRAVILFENCDDIRFENMTLRNTYGKPGQAEVIYNNDNNGQYNISFVNCTLESLQDTFNTKGYCWMYNCTIVGDCDFIWGSPKTCLFEKCEIRAAGDGYIVQARCMGSTDRGFVFLDCNLTKETGVADGVMYLARSSGSTDYYDNVAFINCTVSSVVPDVGWYNRPAPNPSKATAESGWKEYGSKDPSGNVLSTGSRLGASHQLTDEEYEAGYKDRNTIFSGASVGTDWLKE